MLPTPGSPAWDGTTGGAAELPPGTVPARVGRVDRGLLTVLAADGERRVHPTPALHEDTGPAVGDRVALRGECAVALLPRRTAFVRTAAGRTSTAQVVAANLDTVLVVDALGGPVRLRRVERYLAVAWSSGATPVVVLTKADLCADVPGTVAEVAGALRGVEVVAVSAVTGEGMAGLAALLGAGRTAALVGPSGVGKSSLVNALLGEPLVATGPVREADGRGRHTTTARELHRLPGGGLLIDTPGMRELAPGRLRGWRKLQAEAHRQALRSDAGARAAEHARVRAEFRAYRSQPDRIR